MSNVYTLEVLGVGNAVTIDSSPDNGFLNCACGAYGGCMRHDSTSTAINNLTGVLQLAIAGTKNPIIVGHGNEGLLITGQGQNASDPNKYMMTWNEYLWGPEVQRLQPKAFPILTIISCHTGAGQSGADFLFALAKRINHPVQARTGLTYCGGNQLSFENNSTWQVATPTSKPNPIAAPTPHFTTDLSLVAFDKGGINMHLDTTAGVEITIYNASAVAQKDAQRFQVSGDAALGLLSLIDFNNPFKPGGVPAAIVTGILEIKGKDEKGAPLVRDFTIFNDRLLQDNDTMDVFYYLASGFRDSIRIMQP